MSAPPHPTEALAYYNSLTPAERHTVDMHLNVCADCRVLLQDYRQQDAALGALPRLRPRRVAWRPQTEPSASVWLGRLGSALATGGLSAIIWMVALYAQQAVQQAGTDGPPPGGTLSEPGLTLPPAILKPPSPWLPALPWIGLAFLVVGLLFVFSRRSRWPAVGGAALAGLLLITFVPPLSAIPNPAGLYWRLMGGYSYDPNLPFKNAFVIAGAPERLLTPRLEELIGAVGLSPLDPVQPLREFDVLRVGLHPNHPEVALVTTRFVYADGTSRIYPVPLAMPAYSVGGFWRTGWQVDGLERLRSHHLALPGQPFAAADAPIQLGPAQRLEGLSTAAHRLDEVNPYHWLWSSVRVQQLVWSPNEMHFLALLDGARARELWVVPLDGGAPWLAAVGDIHNYGWSPDSHYIVYSRVDLDAATINPARRYALAAIPVAGSRARSERQLVTGLVSDALPGLTAEGVWFLADAAAWIVDYAGGAPRLALRGLGQNHRPLGAPLPAPDGQTLAFACGTGLCLVPNLPSHLGATNPEIKFVDLANVAELSWAPDSSQIAVVTRDPNNLRPVEVVIVSRAGESIMRAAVAPRDATEAPQWLADGTGLLVQTYPQDGRRIIAVDLPSGQVLDLSQEHWDAYFSLAPGGDRLLLNNGRGDFWVAEVIRRR